MSTLRNWLPSSDSQWHQQMWLRLKSKINCCVISHLKVISWNWFCLFHLLSLSHNEKLFCSKIFPSYSEMMTRMCESLPALWEEVIEYLWGKKQKHILEQRGNSKLIAKSWLEFHPWPFPHPTLWNQFGEEGDYDVTSETLWHTFTLIWSFARNPLKIQIGYINLEKLLLRESWQLSKNKTFC